MSEQLKVSVIIPVYNTEQYLRQCLDSVVNQTLEDIEILCVDDGSTDSSPDILREYAEKDERIHVMRQENSGAGPARNYALSAARGEYVLFLDADDFFEPFLISKAYESAEEHSSDIVLFLAKSYDNVTGHVGDMPWLLHTEYFPFKIPFSAKDIAKNIFQITTPTPWNKLFRRNFVQEKNVQFQALHYSNDVAFTFTCLALAERISFVEEPLLYYRRGLTSNAQSRKNAYPRDFFLALKGWKKNLVQYGVFGCFEKSFKKMAEENCAWNFADIKLSVLSRTEREQICRELGVPFSTWNRQKGRAESSDPASAFYCPKISVVVPVYNVAPYLEQCLTSIIGQTLEEIEILCVDDGSTDESPQLLCRFAQQDYRIKVVTHEENKGLLMARKTGVLAARGDYVLFVDSDDYLDAGVCQQVYAAAEEHGADIVQYAAVVDAFAPISEDVLAWRNRYIQPYDGALRGDDILFQCFVRPAYASSMWGKLFKRELCAAGYNQISNMYCYIGEDIYTYFLLSSMASVYVGVRTGAKYHYCYGRGVSNVDTVSLQKFEQFCRMGILADQIKDFLIGQGKLEQLQQAYLCVSERMCTDACRAYGRLAAEDENAGGQMLIRYWKDNECAPEVFEKTLGCSLEEFIKEKADVPIFVKRGAFFADGKKPDISVVVPVYNTEKFLRECLDSIIGQDMESIEIICVNDGSLDNSLSILEEYAARDARVTIISQKNGGLSAARNRGIDEAHGEYIYFCDSDDMLAAGALREMYEQATADDVDILYFNAAVFYENKDMEEKYWANKSYYDNRAGIREVCTGESLMRQLQDKHMYRVSACLQMIRLGFLRRINVRFCEGILYEDNLFTFMTMPQAERTVKVDEAYYLRRYRADSITTKGMRFKNLYGYLKSLILMMNFEETAEVQEDTQETMGHIMNSIYQQVRKIYGQLPASERKKAAGLNPVERFWLQIICGGNPVKAAAAGGGNPGRDEAAGSGNPGRDEAALIRASATYKIGRFITFIPRKVRGGIRCYREHGMRYTMQRVLVHLHIRPDPYRYRR